MFPSKTESFVNTGFLPRFFIEQVMVQLYNILFVLLTHCLSVDLWP